MWSNKRGAIWQYGLQIAPILHCDVYVVCNTMRGLQRRRFAAMQYIIASISVKRRFEIRVGVFGASGWRSPVSEINKPINLNRQKITHTYTRRSEAAAGLAEIPERTRVRHDCTHSRGP